MTNKEQQLNDLECKLLQAIEDRQIFAIRKLRPKIKALRKEMKKC